jgi:predicted TIM-barrel fold metal-dependent hydrolase
MDNAKIDKSLVFAGELNDCPNDWMLEQIKPHRDRLYGVMAYHHPNFRWVDFEKQAMDNEVVGIKFYTGYEHYYPHDLYDNEKDAPVSAIYHNPLELCSQLKIPAIFHCGDCLNSVKKAKLKYSHPLNIDEAAVDYDDVKFVIAHVGFPWVTDTAEVCYKNANVYTDISGFVYGKFRADDLRKFKIMIGQFLEIAGSDKLLFGTDFPISDQKSYHDTLNQIWEFGDAFSIQSLSKNVQKVFNLK